MKNILQGIVSGFERSEQVLSQLRSRGFFDSIKTISTYLSLPEEVQTKSILEYCWAKNIIVTVPEEKDSKMVFREYKKNAELMAPHHPHIFHPKEGKLFIVDQIDLVLVPGLAFSKDGKRLGRGRGFYDRLLASYHGISIGLCFEEQMQEDIPWEEHDQRVGQVIVC